MLNSLIRPKLALALLCSTIIVGQSALAEACQGDIHSFRVQSSNQYIFEGKDTCKGQTGFAIEHNGYEIPVELDGEGSYKTLVAMTAGRNSVFIRTTSGDYIPILDASIDLPKPKAAVAQRAALAIPEPTSTDSDDLANSFIPLPTAEATTEVDAIWNRRNNSDIDVSAMMQAETGVTKTAAPALRPADKFFTVEMTWSEPVDLDLHIFEPKFNSTAVVNEIQPGHIWAKASTSLREQAYGNLDEFETVPAGETRREVYHLEAVNGKIPEGAYQLKIDYRDRTVRGNVEPMTCGTGVYAAPKAKLHIKTADFDTVREFVIPAIECGAALTRGKVLATVGTIQLQ